MSNEERAADAEARVHAAVAALEGEGRKPTARAVAERAKCSLRTVSRMMHPPAAAAESEADRIIRAVRDLRLVDAAKALSAAADGTWEEVWQKAWEDDEVGAVFDWGELQGICPEEPDRSIAMASILALAVRMFAGDE